MAPGGPIETVPVTITPPSGRARESWPRWGSRIPPPQRPGMGDMTTGLLVAGSVAMALLDRQRSGQGQEVDISLHNTGLWVLGADVQAALLGAQPARLAPGAVAHPL